jgi:hypothetical protein
MYRSNKASGHKNLRCFPHCCGGHNPKSFCGSGLFVEIMHSKSTSLLVLGRFEEVDRIPMEKKIYIGQYCLKKKLFEEVKTQERPFGKWFRGVLVPKSEESSTQTFLLNGNRQSWHYGWQSSRLNCRNTHVFKVYFFHTIQEEMTYHNSNTGNQVQCIAVLESSAFRISSSRKARKTQRIPCTETNNEEASTQVPIPAGYTPIPAGYTNGNESNSMGQGLFPPRSTPTIQATVAAVPVFSSLITPSHGKMSKDSSSSSKSSRTTSESDPELLRTPSRKRTRSMDLAFVPDALGPPLLTSFSSSSCLPQQPMVSRRIPLGISIEKDKRRMMSNFVFGIELIRHIHRFETGISQEDTKEYPSSLNQSMSTTATTSTSHRVHRIEMVCCKHIGQCACKSSPSNLQEYTIVRVQNPLLEQKMGQLIHIMEHVLTNGLFQKIRHQMVQWTQQMSKQDVTNVVLCEKYASIQRLIEETCANAYFFSTSTVHMDKKNITTTKEDDALSSFRQMVLTCRQLVQKEKWYQENKCFMVSPPPITTTTTTIEKEKQQKKRRSKKEEEEEVVVVEEEKKEKNQMDASCCPYLDLFESYFLSMLDVWGKISHREKEEEKKEEEEKKKKKKKTKK